MFICVYFFSTHGFLISFRFPKFNVNINTRINNFSKKDYFVPKVLISTFIINDKSIEHSNILDRVLALLSTKICDIIDYYESTSY